MIAPFALVFWAMSSYVVARGDAVNTANLIMPLHYWATPSSSLVIYQDVLVLDDDGSTSYSFTFSGLSGTGGATSWTHTAGSVGDYSLGLFVGGSSRASRGESTIHVVADSVAATKIVLIGDSTTDNSIYGCSVASAITGETMLGTQLDGSCVNEGYSGQSWSWFGTNAASPLTDAGGNLDIASYLTAIGANPDVIVYHLGINDFFTLSLDSSFVSTVYARMEIANSIFAAFKAALPSVYQGVFLMLPGNATVANWESDYDPPIDDPWLWEQKINIINRIMIERFGNAQSQGIYLLPSSTTINPANGYTNALHPDQSGYDDLAAMIAAWVKAVR